MEEKIKEILIKHLYPKGLEPGTYAFYAHNTLDNISKEIASLIQPSQVISEGEIMPILNKIAISKGFECFDQAQVILNREKLHELYFEGFKKCLSLTQSDAVGFHEWADRYYSLVYSPTIDVAKWVNHDEHDILVNGSGLHYIELITKYGKTTEELYNGPYQEYKLKQQKQNEQSRK